MVKDIAILDSVCKMVESFSNEYDKGILYSYAIIDGAKADTVWIDLEDGNLRYDTLFVEEKLKSALERVAPFFVELEFENDREAEDSIRLLKRCYGEGSMLLIFSPLRFEEALKIAREIFYLKDEEGNIEGVFRFYEPTIFHEVAKLPTKDALKVIFKEDTIYMCEDFDKRYIVLYKEFEEEVVREIFDLKRGEESG